MTEGNRTNVLHRWRRFRLPSAYSRNHLRGARARAVTFENAFFGWRGFVWLRSEAPSLTLISQFWAMVFVSLHLIGGDERHRFCAAPVFEGSFQSGFCLGFGNYGELVLYNVLGEIFRAPLCLFGFATVLDLSHSAFETQVIPHGGRHLWLITQVQDPTFTVL